MHPSKEVFSYSFPSNVIFIPSYSTLIVFSLLRFSRKLFNASSPATVHEVFLLYSLSNTLTQHQEAYQLPIQVYTGVGLHKWDQTEHRLLIFSNHITSYYPLLHRLRGENNQKSIQFPTPKQIDSWKQYMKKIQFDFRRL